MLCCQMLAIVQWGCMMHGLHRVIMMHPGLPEHSCRCLRTALV